MHTSERCQEGRPGSAQDGDLEENPAAASRHGTPRRVQPWREPLSPLAAKGSPGRAAAWASL
eukprot:1616183-Pyramimonas_sp.AAC.1